MVYAIKYGPGNLGNRVGPSYRPVTYGGFRNALNAGFRAYHGFKAVNKGIRNLQQSTPKRSHPRDWLSPAKRGKSMTPRTQTRATTRVRRGWGAQNTKSSGFLGTRRKPRKPKGWQSGKGVTMTYETGDLLAAQDIVYVGHATMPRDRVFEQTWQSILKLLCTKMNIRIRDFDAPLSEIPIPATSQFRFTFKADANTPTTSTESYVVVAGDTFNTVVDYFAAVCKSELLLDIMPSTFAYVGDGGIQNASIALEALMLHFDVKSTLKIQNRSINSTGNDEADEVDNVPLYGKSIGGNGTGVQARFPGSSAPAQIFGKLTNGLISKVNQDVNAKEPLSGYFWPKSTEQGKVHLDPGCLKTSVLTTRKNISFRQILKNYSTLPFANTGQIVSVGKYRFFQLEKMIDTGVTINLIIAYELNSSMSCYATTKYNWTTAPIYKKQN